MSRSVDRVDENEINIDELYNFKSQVSIILKREVLQGVYRYN